MLTDDLQGKGLYEGKQIKEGREPESMVTVESRQWLN